MLVSRLVLLAAAATAALPLAAAPAPEPKLLSMLPFCGQRGAPFTATLRGTGLAGATAVFLPGDGLKVTIQAIEREPDAEGGGRNRTAADLVRLRVEAPATLEPGRYPIRLVTPGGVSNALPLIITAEPVSLEPEGIHESVENAIPMASFPAVFAGRLLRRGEFDLYAFEAQAGETLTFTAVSGLPSVGAPGGNANGFDPSLTILEPSGSWFDAGRLNRLAFNDEPLWVIGRLTDAHLSFRFPRTGRYFLRIEAFSGQGGRDYSYQLIARRGEHPPPEATSSAEWEERSFTRRLSPTRLAELARRAAAASDRQPTAETYRAAPVAVAPPTVKLPANIEGAIETPGETHHVRFTIDKPTDLAIEVETPAVAPPLFNPIVRLLDAAGEEVATNIFAGRGNCTGALTKSLQAKAVLPLRNLGAYTVQVRDTTADFGEAGFRYRVQLRPQLPHLGQIRIEADALNLRRGDAKTVRVIFDREEDFQGAVAVFPESLPPGVHAVAGADFEPDKDPPPYPGKRERYVPRTERSVVVFTAADDAPVTSQPAVVTLAVRPVAGGKPGVVIASKQIPLMVLPNP
jgi:hypothetical protein